MKPNKTNGIFIMNHSIGQGAKPKNDLRDTIPLCLSPSTVKNTIEKNELDIDITQIKSIIFFNIFSIYSVSIW